MPPTKPPYPAQFRAEAVRLVRESGKAMGQIAKDLGVSTESLRKWVRQAEIDSGDHEWLTKAECEELGRLRREMRILREERDTLTSRGLVCQADQPDRIEVFRYVEHEKPNHAVPTLCWVLGVCTSGHYAWRIRGPSRRARQETELTEDTIRIHKDSRVTYGTPRIHIELAMGAGMCCSRKRVARQMRKAGLVGIHRWRRRGIAHRSPRREPAPDLVEPRLTPEAHNCLWVADTTEQTADEGKLYLAVVIEAFPRMVPGWSMGDRSVAELAVDAVNMAVWNCSPDHRLVHHPDHAAQRTAMAFGRTLKEAGIIGSMGTVGGALDNAVAESFFPMLETQAPRPIQLWSNRQALASAIFEYVEGFESRRGRHFTLGYLRPLHYERRRSLTGRTQNKCRQSVA